MKNSTKIFLRFAWAIVVVWIGCLIWLNIIPKAPIATPVDTGSVEYILSGYIDTGATLVTGTETYMEEENLRWEVTVAYDPQPQALPGNYQDNGSMLRAWAQNNVKTLDIPAWAKDVTIAFKLAKQSKYGQIPGNIQASVGTTKLCNGRLVDMNTYTEDFVGNGVYQYKLDNVTTQDHPNGADWSYAIGKTLVIKAWIGESNNYLENITVSRTL